MVSADRFEFGKAHQLLPADAKRPPSGLLGTIEKDRHK